MRRLSRFRRLPRPAATVRPTTAAGLAGEGTIPKSVRRWQLEPTFGRLVDHALEATGAPVPCDLAGGPAARLFHLVSLLDFVRDTPGAMAEVGVYRGESALLACKWRQLDDPGFRGEGFHLFDSFAGLSDLGPEDYVEDRIEGFRPRHAGMFSASLEAVRAALAEFPEVSFHPGWIPECFETGPDVTYRYVHIDVDTYQPTLDSLRFFAPRLEGGGVIVIDDYGSVRWPGVAQAATEYAADHGGRVLELATGQALYLPDPPRGL